MWQSLFALILKAKVYDWLILIPFCRLQHAGKRDWSSQGEDYQVDGDPGSGLHPLLVSLQHHVPLVIPLTTSPLLQLSKSPVQLRKGLCVCVYP
jgi:hypothetical protein